MAKSGFHGYNREKTTLKENLSIDLDTFDPFVLFFDSSFLFPDIFVGIALI